MTAHSNLLDSLLVAHPVPTWRRLAWPVIGLIFLGGTWANFAKLDEVSVAPGSVIPQGKSKIIQHLEGGIIKDIFIKEGDVVSAGETLMQLDLGSRGANIKELEVRLDSQLLTRARLSAEAKGLGEPVFPPDIAINLPEQANAQRQAFKARQRQLTAGTNVLKELVKQRKQDIQELHAKLSATKSNLALTTERFKISTDLLKSGLTSRVDHLRLEAEMKTLQGELKSAQASVPRAQAALSEAKRRVNEDVTRFRRESQDALNKTEQTISRIGALLRKANEQKMRATIKSPIDGIIINLAFTAAGNVVKPGEAIMEIVPTGGNLVVEGRMKPADRGYVAEGQHALVKIMTYDYARYGGIEGTVILVAPDTSTDDNGRPYFRVVVQPEKTYLGTVPGDLPILPGMQSTLDIRTGQKTVMNFLIKPVLKLKHEAFRER